MLSTGALSLMERLLRALLDGGGPTPAGRCGIAADVLLGHVTGFALQEQSQPAGPPAVAAQRYADPCARFPLLMGPLTERLDQDEKSVRSVRLLCAGFTAPPDGGTGVRAKTGRPHR
ncbi:hypothetical protein [Kitasatospora sp. NRRL B-11411]|uniref:hypothetical protein n=1 Tax=Kitasatospora sp. NRRL B-11411 TaxID=1463822 RepID=UPI0004C3036C|nr:hypothetical protein [Kitasatospora sp. NRRL B-11411]